MKMTKGRSLLITALIAFVFALLVGRFLFYKTGPLIEITGMEKQLPEADCILASERGLAIGIAQIMVENAYGKENVSWRLVPWSCKKEGNQITVNADVWIKDDRGNKTRYDIHSEIVHERGDRAYPILLLAVGDEVLIDNRTAF